MFLARATSLVYLSLVSSVLVVSTYYKCMYVEVDGDIRSKARVVVVVDERTQQIHVLALLLDRGDHVGEL